MNDDKPICSVVVPVYNSGSYIARTLDSILGQTVRDIEVIVIDDGSKDDSRDIIAAYAEKDGRLRPLLLAQNQGVCHARNLGVGEAKADWVAFLDSDDFWAEDKLEKQLALVGEGQAALYYTGAVFILHEGQGGKRIHVPERIGYSDLLRGSNIILSSVMAKREALLAFPMERPDLHEDFICWYRILQQYGPAIGLDKPLLFYRLTPGSKSRSKKKSARMTWNSYGFLGIKGFARLRAFAGYALHGLKRYRGTGA